MDKLLALVYDRAPDFVLPDFRFTGALQFIAVCLRDFSSRVPTPWGIPLTGDESQVAYVLGRRTHPTTAARPYARRCEIGARSFWPVVHPLLAKDILLFPTAVLPSMAAIRQAN